MKIRAGYRITFDCAGLTPMNLLISVHPDRRADLITDDVPASRPHLKLDTCLDRFGNLLTRVLAPPGPITLSADFLISDCGEPEPCFPDAGQAPIDLLPAEVLEFLLASRYCETDEMMDLAWGEFGSTEPGWARVQAIVDWTHKTLEYDYKRARSTRTARQTYDERTGVCRDYAHLAIALCRCMNIPARYCTGYLGDIGVPPLPTAMDFHAWFEVYLAGAWHVFDARHNERRIGRILMARGRDAADVPISSTFGAAYLTEFSVITEEVAETALLAAE